VAPGTPGQAKKVRCKTCQFERDFRHGKGGRPKTSEMRYCKLLFIVVVSLLCAACSAERPPDEVGSFCAGPQRGF